MTKPDASPGGTGSRTGLLPYAVMLVTPLFFSTNMIFGRLVVPEVAPFTLAFLRWTLAALLLAPWVLAASGAARAYLREARWHWLLLGFLGMWVCGGVVYFALARTSATNGTLIYTTSPLMILVLERLFFARRIGLRQIAGIVIGFAGVAIIVLRGSLDALATLDLNIGDLLFVVAAFSWAVYSVLLRTRATRGLDDLALFGLIAAAGALLLAPVAAGEWWLGAPMPVTARAWTGIGGVVLFASLLAFSGFQYGVRRLGAATTGAFMYLLPPYGVGLAVFVLGEPFRPYHAVGIATVLTGLVLATWHRPASARAAAAE